jgi:hypothetical protein
VTANGITIEVAGAEPTTEALFHVVLKAASRT